MHAMLVRVMMLYAPLCAVLLAWLGRPLRKRMGAAILMGVLWVLLWLPAVQFVNENRGWWTFSGGEAAFLRMPIEVYAGWVALWGALPVLVFRRVKALWVVLCFAALDAVMMPLCSPLVRLAKDWWVGELAALAVVLIPAVLLARWTLEDRRVGWRAAMQLALAAGLFLWMLPGIALTLRGLGWAQLPRGKALAMAVQVLAILTLPGASAVQEFCDRGEGTPIPQDPPKKLVVSGVYRYVANPMQMSCALATLAWGATLKSAAVALIGLMSFVYSAGIARWDEREDLRERFGERWARYRAEVRDWRCRWRPYIEPGSEAVLYVAETCGICSEVAAWFAERSPLGMRIIAAESFPGGPLRRMRYVAADGWTEDGLRAFARGLEHLNAAWMLVGAAMRLPGVRVALQAIADASGMGPRALCVVERHAGDTEAELGESLRGRSCHYLSESTARPSRTPTKRDAPCSFRRRKC